MATKKKQNRTKNGDSDGGRLTPQTDSPFQHISFSPEDLRNAGGGGGPPKIFDAEGLFQHRLGLAESLNQAWGALSSDMGMHPGSLGGLVFKLHPDGIAKSHRPLQLVDEAALIHAGHEKVEEMLVAAHGPGFNALHRLILERDIQAIRANVSVIQRIEPWSRVRRNPEGTLALRERESALLRVFRYQSDWANQTVFSSIRELLGRLGLHYRVLPNHQRGWHLLRLTKLSNASEEALNVLLSHPGVRRLLPEPHFKAAATSSISMPAAAPALLGTPRADMPVVAVFDTGVSPSASHLNGWVVGRDTYVLPPDTAYQHGTNVASLVAGAHALNGGHPDLPVIGTLVYDVCALDEGANGSPMTDLAMRLEEALSKRPDIKIWNLSLGASSSCDDQVFSEFGKTLDGLSEKFDVLFIVAAGNYVKEPRRTWPDGSLLDDRISSPADSVLSLTVGSVGHVTDPTALTGAGEPTPYSRRGPGPAFTPKPDIVHVGGGVHTPWNVGPASLRVLLAGNEVASSFGTSFAAPVASALAAHLWQGLEGHSQLVPRPALVKALLIHSAQLASPPYSPLEKRYFGAGLPIDIMTSLYDSQDSFTLVFDAQLVGGLAWRKAPYPIPEALRVDGKFCGEAVITAVYAPPLDPDAGAEYVRAHVELGFGTLEGEAFSGKVPMKGEVGVDGYEAAQIEHGGKWAPVRMHRKSFPQGSGAGDWALQARVYSRALEPAPKQALQVFIICTLRALDGNPNVHADGMRALAATNWVRQNLPVRVPVSSF